MAQNGVYGVFDGNDQVSNNGIASTVRKNHENLISANVAADLNTYRTYGASLLVVDADPLTRDSFDEEGALRPNGERTVRSTGVRSIFNKLHAVPVENADYGWRVSQNMPLLDSPATRQKQRAMNSCTVRDLVQKSQQGLLGTAVYDWSDFMYCTYLGRMSNNYLITLRRYPIPCTDYVKPYGNPKAIKGDGTTGTSKTSTQTDIGGIPLGCMVTWLGTPGNEMSEILKYSFHMPFKEARSKFENDGHQDQQARNPNSGGGIGGAFGKAFSGAASKHVLNSVMPGIYNYAQGSNYQSIQPYTSDSNRAYKEVDMIKSIWVRDGDAGLTFNQEFTLTFDYQLRSYDGVNGKQAMLDLIGNILTVCYTQGDFWGGAYRNEAHGHSLQPLSSLECMRKHGTFTEYVGAFERDFQRTKQSIVGQIQSKGVLGVVKDLLNNLGAALLGGGLEDMPVAQQQGVNALLSDSAIGQWHVTIGNPCAPIMSIGNLIIDDCTVEHYGPLGIDDFPIGLKITVKLKGGKPRDKRLIERMYNGGNDRIYMPLDQSVFEMLKQAEQINNRQAIGDKKMQGYKDYASKGPTSAGVDTARSVSSRNKDEAGANANAFGTEESTSDLNTGVRLDIMETLSGSSTTERIFGSGSTYGVCVSAGEVHMGVPKQITDKYKAEG